MYKPTFKVLWRVINRQKLLEQDRFWIALSIAEGYLSFEDDEEIRITPYGIKEAKFYLENPHYLESLND